MKKSLKKSKIEEKYFEAPKFSNEFKKDTRESRRLKKMEERSKSREEYFSSLEFEVLKKLNYYSKGKKLPDLRPEQYKDKVKGLLTQNDLTLDSQKNLKIRNFSSKLKKKNFSKSAKKSQKSKNHQNSKMKKKFFWIINRKKTQQTKIKKFQ